MPIGIRLEGCIPCFGRLHKLYLQIKFRLCVGYWPDLKNPKSYNEKLQWLKLHDHHEEYTMMVDKVAVKDYVAEIVGKEYVIPTLGIYDNVEQIDWSSFPDQFVVKSANDSGGVVVCKDKAKLDIESSIVKLKTLGDRDYTKFNKEYPYKNVPHRFIAEQYIEDESGYELKDYKFFCFYGKPEFLFVATGRQSGDVRFDFFDTDFNHIEVLNGHDNADIRPIKPLNFDKMLEIASKISENIPHVRVDLYNVNGKIYFGEMTFFHFSGMTPFEPESYDFKFGDFLKLPN